MAECEYCGDEFENKTKLHYHWGEEHEEELNSHDMEKVKKARRKKEEEKQQVMQKRKKLAGYSFIGILAVLMAGYAATNIIPQMMAGPAAELNSEYLEDRAILGSENASVTIVEFGDYRCGHCQRFETGTKTQLEEEGYFDNGNVKFHMLHFPVVGPTTDSVSAAEAAECAGSQSNEAYWNLHEALFEVQGNIDYSDQSLIDLAEENTDVDIGEFESCLTSGEFTDRVNEDQTLGGENSVSATPTVFINGERVPDPMNYDQVEAMIEDELE